MILGPDRSTNIGQQLVCDGKFIGSRKVFRLDRCTSYEQGIAYMVDCLTQSGQLDKAFKERLQCR